MRVNFKLCTLTILVAAVAAVHAIETDNTTGRSTLLDNGLSRTLKHIYTHCAESDDIFWCLKLQGTKLLGRALKVQNIKIIDGISIVRKTDNTTRIGRATELNLSNRDLEHLSAKSLDALLFERFINFVQSRQVQVSFPRLLTLGQHNSQDLVTGLLNLLAPFMDNEVVEGRKKKDRKYLGPFIAAVMLKAAILKMAYHSIAIVAGKALIVGKIALIISAIIGLKKLVSNESEKTTYEIVKHPQVQQSHTYSSSHAGEYESGHESGSYHRSISDAAAAQDKAYQAWVPTKTS
ncbi:uncharacterized protein LOC119676270 [Teleopsis dalmanni]|uniref:uncharacterized protein LOC119676270 n=1 Tax=Teleopsis dalmanni TaxID=139649 RepID=UPI0018CD967D|nr:uncharacterized protein LOC119676270 [Teleopsis dalmanni]